MRFSVGAAAPNVLAAVVAAALAAAAVLVAAADHRRAETTATPNKPGGKPFSVWFRAEPDLPRKRDMKAKKLNRLIGSDYDEMWMSKTPMLTAAAANGTAGWNRPVTPDVLSFPEQLPAQYHEMLRTWLARRSTCPVEFVWTDLGKSFWPRWIKQGRCGRTATMSCSWPPGMTCMPSSVRVLSLLRWHCWLKNRKNRRKNRDRKSIKSTTDTSIGKKKKTNKFRCLWIKVPYPVTEDCTCSCRKHDN